MIIHSIIPYEVIFSEQSENNKKTKYITYKEAILEVSPISAHGYKVNRVISTCLNSYLDSEIEPGAIIKYDAREE
ncbi:MAG: YlzJ-like protein [Clostridiales bacterium]|jgi:hypothetical protein|nr:YlzJ-like protein [Clostridiales bacterium]MDK2932344.1 YlzJ-like protein [Clostridiales bacterium]